MRGLLRRRDGGCSPSTMWARHSPRPASPGRRRGRTAQRAVNLELARAVCAALHREGKGSQDAKYLGRRRPEQKKTTYHAGPGRSGRLTAVADGQQHPAPSPPRHRRRTSLSEVTSSPWRRPFLAAASRKTRPTATFPAGTPASTPRRLRCSAPGERRSWRTISATARDKPGLA